MFLVIFINNKSKLPSSYSSISFPLNHENLIPDKKRTTLPEFRKGGKRNEMVLLLLLLLLPNSNKRNVGSSWTILSLRVRFHCPVISWWTWSDIYLIESALHKTCYRGIFCSSIISAVQYSVVCMIILFSNVQDWTWVIVRTVQCSVFSAQAVFDE